MPQPMLLMQTVLDTHTPSYMRSSGSPGGVEATLGWWLTFTAIAVVAVVTVVLLIAVLRRREANTDEHTDAPANIDGGRMKVVSGVNWIYIGLAITVVILLAAFGGMLATLASAARPPSSPPITMNVTAHQWWWEVQVEDSVPGNAFVTANEVHVPVGVPIRVRVQSPDVIHSFWVPELAGKMDVIPGQLNETWMRANRAGTFRGACAEYCGLQHAHMAFTVVAETPGQYAAWVAHQRASQPVPAALIAPASAGTSVNTPVNTSINTPLNTGEVVFASTCGGCHAVRGTDALGRVGPDLTHVASRLTIGAGMLDNTHQNLMKWVSNAQAVKPGVFMPKMDLRHDDLAAVVAYLETLR